MMRLAVVWGTQFGRQREKGEVARIASQSGGHSCRLHLAPPQTGQTQQLTADDLIVFTGPK
jgi:hypothetical protein